MDNKKLLMMGAAMVALSPLTAQKAQAATATVNVQAIVLNAIQAATVQSLNFGTFSITGAGTIAVDTLGAYNPAPVSANPIGASAKTQAKLQIKATGGYALGVDASAGVGAKINNGVDDMTIGAVDFNGLGSTGTVTIAGVGLQTATYPIGASLNFGAADSAGTYTGTFNVTVSYN